MTVFLELLGNALRFAGEQTSLTFSASVDASVVVATLREGPSMPPALPPQEWGGRPLWSTRRCAYGLGLFRRIIEAQGGTYHAGYSASAEELTTRVTLPLARVP